jgi:hypothetical protein
LRRAGEDIERQSINLDADFPMALCFVVARIEVRADLAAGGPGRRIPDNILIARAVVEGSAAP